MTDSWKVWVRKWAKLIMSEGSITRLNLIERTNSSPWILDKLQGYMHDMFPEIKYNKQLRVFYLQSMENTLYLSLEKDKEKYK